MAMRKANEGLFMLGTVKQKKPENNADFRYNYGKFMNKNRLVCYNIQIRRNEESIMGGPNPAELIKSIGLELQRMHPKSIPSQELAKAMRVLHDVLKDNGITAEDLQGSEKNKQILTHALLGIMALNRKGNDVNPKLIQHLIINIARLLKALKKSDKKMQPQPGMQEQQDEEIDEALENVRKLAPQVAPSKEMQDVCDELDRDDKADKLNAGLPTPEPQQLHHDELKNVTRSFDDVYQNEEGNLQLGAVNRDDEVVKLADVKVMDVIDLVSQAVQALTQPKASAAPAPAPKVPQQPIAPPAAAPTKRSPFSTTPKPPWIPK